MMSDDRTEGEPTVAEGIVRMFEEANAAGTETTPPAAATPAESARLMDEAFERWERAKGLNVVPFPRQAAR
ncbi:hypothetical protein [Methylobacterium symbioticum]|uniref:Uncharacterized protein n=1 Tax=Methylobacterium symbioticum TaxID=2584084 RepID=A0A509E966_9HYPH|nr:hypothetical protein [Methylobacterium symbioticum]VUD70658.1 hypothetical protein MET9862_01230 [Methylobacterium symbioticum]